MVMGQLIMSGRSEGMFCKRENIGLVLKKEYKGFGWRKKEGVRNILE